MLNIIEKIEEAKGKEKIEVLQENESILSILQYAYDPFKKYYITAPDNVFGREGGTNLTRSSKQLLDRLSSRELSGTEAHIEVIKHIGELNKESAELFKRILNKDLRCGVNIKTINKAFPGAIKLRFDGEEKPSVMLLNNFDEKKCNFPCLAAIKKDGVRARFIDGELITREGHRLIGLDHITEVLNDFEEEFDGELCVPEYDFDSASGLLRSNNNVPSAIYHIFDMPSIDEIKAERYYILRSISDYLPEDNRIKILQHFTFFNLIDLYEFYLMKIKDGEEGIVVYDYNSKYEDKRSYDWMRMVPAHNLDLEVIEFFEGRGRLADNLGGIVVMNGDRKVKVGSGFKDRLSKKESEGLKKDIDKKIYYQDHKLLTNNNLLDIFPLLLNIRSIIWANQEVFIGRKAKVSYKEITKTNSLRQPRFKGWRFDK